MLEILMFSLLLSLDAFTTSIAYGVNHIRIPKLSCVIMSLMSVLFLGISIFVSWLLKGGMDPDLCKWISFGILILLGIYQLLGTYIKQLFSRYKFSFSIRGIHVIFDIYTDETKADLDDSKILSGKEAILLGAAISIDSLATGLSIGLGSISYVIFLLFVFVFTIFAILLGDYIGKMIPIRIDLSWVSGVMLIGLGIIRLI